MFKPINRACKNLFALAPPLKTNPIMDDFRAFMQEETYSFSARYAKTRVIIHGDQHLLSAITQKSVILAFLHYGSFFLTGGALHHQLNIPYTAIASRRNIQLLPANEKLFWQGVHTRSGKLYEEPLIFTDESALKSIRWLTKHQHVLGVALDVHEIEYPKKRLPFSFLGQRVYLPIGAARLAKLTSTPMMPACIQFDPILKVHHLYLNEVVVVNEPLQATQACLDALAPFVQSNPSQQFFDIAQAFANPI